MRPRRRATGQVAALALLLALTACSLPTAATGVAAPTTAPRSTRTTGPAHRPSRRPRPSASPTHTSHAATGWARWARLPTLAVPAWVAMPRRRRTPGVTSSVVTQRSIDRTICVPGYSGSVRPSSSYTTELKVQQVGSGYGFRGIRSPSFYEEDHLISLELGGSPTASGNLWPEPYSRGARLKDTLENTLHELVCSHRLALRTAQADIAVNWYEAYVEFVGTPRRPAGAGWSSGTATSPTARGCEPGYSPCLPVTNDLNCSDISGPVRVTGSDPYHLDADGDGWGCE